MVRCPSLGELTLEVRALMDRVKELEDRVAVLEGPEEMTVTEQFITVGLAPDGGDAAEFARIHQ